MAETKHKRVSDPAERDQLNRFFTGFYIGVKRELPLTVNNWVLMNDHRAIVSEPLTRYGIPGRQPFKSMDQAQRRLVCTRTSLGNCVVFERYGVNEISEVRPYVLQLIACDDLLRVYGITNPDNMDRSKLELIFFQHYLLAAKNLSKMKRAYPNPHHPDNAAF